MSYRLSKIYTRTGDDGYTQIAVGKRIAKDDLHIEALGTLDELNSAIGFLLAHDPCPAVVSNYLRQIQHDLFDLGGELCPPHHEAIAAQKTRRLEKMIDKWNKTLPPLQEFILPGGNIESASCHLARAICRRAERCLVKLHKKTALNPEILRYINRLSDTLFVAARILAREDKTKEILWKHKRKHKSNSLEKD